jgi:hypothetical protein
MHRRLKNALHLARDHDHQRSVLNDGGQGSDEGLLPAAAVAARAGANLGVGCHPDADHARRVGRQRRCGAADGYDVRIDRTDTVIGGTSAAAPPWAGLIARINAMRGRLVGLINVGLMRSPN